MAKIVELRRARQHLVVEPTTRRIRELLEPQLTYVERKTLRGRARFEKADALREGIAEYPGPEHTDFITHQLFDYDFKERFHCGFGFYHRITETLEKAGYTVRYQDLQPHKRPEVYEPQWERALNKVKLRYKNAAILTAMCANPCGRIACPPGYGKTFSIVLATRVFPKAKFHIVVPQGSVVQMIWRQLMAYIPDVGIVTGNKKRFGRRVTVYSAYSLHHSDFDADFLLADEIHLLAADTFVPWLVRYGRSRNFGFSATQDMRLDNRDIRIEGIFGPKVVEVSYQKILKRKMVVPIEVHWTIVRMDKNPVAGFKDTVRMRRGIWRNKPRNRLIARDARLYDGDTQVLISVTTLEHAVRLKKLLPEYTLVYGDNAMEKVCTGFNPRGETYRQRYIRKGLIPEDEPKMDYKRREHLQKQFEQNKLKKVISTTVWSTGVDFRYLRVLIRADGLASPISDTQIPGRTSRIADGKQGSIVHDYDDRWDGGFAKRTQNRKTNYKAHGWSQVYPTPGQKQLF